MTQAFLRQIDIRRLLTPKAMLFGACVVNFLVRLMYVRRVELEAKAAVAAGYWGYSEHWNPFDVMWEPFWLLVATIALMLNRSWSLLFSLLISGRLVYLLAYLPWRAVHNAHDVPMFSWQAVEKLWFGVYLVHPEYFFELIVSGVIFVYAGLRCAKVMNLTASSSISGG